jgi:hypothetical protein
VKDNKNSVPEVKNLPHIEESSYVVQESDQVDKNSITEEKNSIHGKESIQLSLESDGTPLSRVQDSSDVALPTTPSSPTTIPDCIDD